MEKWKELGKRKKFLVAVGVLVVIAVVGWVIVGPANRNGRLGFDIDRGSSHGFFMVDARSYSV